MSAVAERLRTLALEQPAIARPAPPPQRAPRPAAQKGRGRGALLAAIAAALTVGAAAGSAATGWLAPAPAATPASAPTASETRAAPSALVASGFIVARRGATIGSQTTGQLREILVGEGDRVAAGQVIARVDAGDALAALARARSEAAMARAGLAALGHQRERAAAALDRREALAARGFATAAALEESRAEAGTLGARVTEARASIAAADAAVRAAELAVARHAIRAPFSGVVVDKNAEVGELVSPVSAGGGFTRTGVVTLVDMASLAVEVDVSEAYIGSIAPGQPVALSLDAVPGERFPARVKAVVPSADRAKATVRVDIALDRLDPRMLPHMAVKAAFLPRTTGALQ